MLAVSSYAARELPDGENICDLSRLSGNISFGSFLDLAVELSGAAIDHPLRSQIAAGLATKGKGKRKRRGKAEEGLTSILELRNDHGHDLSSLSHPKAVTLLRDVDPVGSLVAAIEGLTGLLSLPLFVIENQELSKGSVLARRLLLMGEGADPEPESIVLSAGVHNPKEAYVGVPGGVLCLSPLMTWSIAKDRENYRVFILDSVGSNGVRFRAVDAKPRACESGESQSVSSFLKDPKASIEQVRLSPDQDFLSAWLGRRRRIKELARRLEGAVPWDEFDAATLAWFAGRRDPDARESPWAVISADLLDGRETLSLREREQLVLLFGQGRTIRSLIGREMMDLRARKHDEGRWDERIESHHNVLECLKQAVDFFTRHIEVQGATFDGLDATSGSADYIAMREALVNFFIHQDYADASAAAQVELTPDRAVFFNPGRALVSSEALVEGGKNQARNPIIARALRLVGFAELAGSGLRELQRTWRGAKRRPPRIESDESANTFTLTLDWRVVPDAYDEFWKERIGVHLSESEAQILNLALDPGGVSLEEAASATGQRLEDAKQALDTLVRQVLVDESDGRFRVKDHLRDLVK